MKKKFTLIFRGAGEDAEYCGLIEEYPDHIAADYRSDTQYNLESRECTKDDVAHYIEDDGPRLDVVWGAGR